MLSGKRSASRSPLKDQQNVTSSRWRLVDLVDLVDRVDLADRVDWRESGYERASAKLELRFVDVQRLNPMVKRRSWNPEFCRRP